MRNLSRVIVTVTGLLFPVSCFAQEITETWNFPEARQFDFWIGEWSVKNRFKQDDNTWEDQGGATVKIFRVLDGKAIMEFWSGTARDHKETKGFSLRYFDVRSRKWKLALNWPQPNNGGFFFLDGEFRNNRGDFFVDYTNQQGEHVINRYTFSDISANSLRWNDGTSLDGGKTWETKWIMEFTRTAEEVTWPSTHERFHTQDNNSWNTTDEAGRFDNLVGFWQGKSNIDAPEGSLSREIQMKVWKVLNGSAYLLILESRDEHTFKEIGMLTYREMNSVWLHLSLDNQEGTGYNLMAWRPEDGKPLFKNPPGSRAAASTMELELTEGKMEIIRTDEANKTMTKTVLSKIKDQRSMIKDQ